MNNTLPDSQPQIKADKSKLTSLRIAAGMFFASAITNLLGVVFYAASNGWQSLGYENVVILIINILIGVVLLLGSARYALGWAFLFILYGIYQLISGNSYAFILDIAFSSSLILVLIGKPSKVRMITAVAVFVVVYLGLRCLGFTSYFILGVR
jgi:hypothetical protein